MKRKKFEKPQPSAPAAPHAVPPPASSAAPMWMRFFCAAVLLVAAFIRFYDLGRSEVRGDELNFLNWSLRKPPVSEIWQNPPWMDQIPLSESIAILWARVRPGPPSEASIREPFAFMGWFTIAGGMWWMARRWTLSAALLFGAWMAFLPFHVFQSREAYYYVVAMAFGLGMALATIDHAARAARGNAPRPRDYAIWLAWATVACLAHMSVWALAGVCWLGLALATWRGLEAAARTRALLWLTGTGIALVILMARWIGRAIRKILEAKAAAGVLTDTGFIGGALEWVAPRVLPMFVAGYNAIGFALLALVLICAARAAANWRALDLRLRIATQLTAAAVGIAYLYVSIVGRGSAKISYFAAVLPLFLVWAAATADRAWDALPTRWATISRAAFPLALLALLAEPAWQVTRLTGKPVPYRALQQKLDEVLPPGSVAIIDRWFEPWNEMVPYAPSNVAVTFTVPDEPFDNYVRMQWRDTTRARIEAGGIDAFIRLARNHEERVGLWTWPETWFARHAVVSNPAAYWLRDRGFAPEQDYHKLNDNRLRVDIFYNTREDAVRRAIESGRRFPVFYGPDLPFEKSGPMGFMRFRTQQLMDWRVLSATGTLEIINTYEAPREVTIEVKAISPTAGKTVGAPPAHRFHFPPNQFATWTFGPVMLQPGANRLSIRDIQPSPVSPPLFISEVRALETPAAP
jgi:hypothetical protein